VPDPANRRSGPTRPPFRSTARRAARLLIQGDLAGVARRLRRYLLHALRGDSGPTLREWRNRHVALSKADRDRIATWRSGLGLPAGREPCRTTTPTRLPDPQELLDDPDGLTIVVDYQGTLHDGATMAFTLAAANHRDAVVFYGDHEVVADDGPVDVALVPDWNLDLALGSCYPGPALALRNGHLASVLADGPPTSLHDLLLRATTSVSDRVVHLPHVLSSTTDLWPPSDIGAVVRATGVARTSITTDRRSGACRVRWPLPDPPPTVSVVVPTRDQGRMLRRCVDGLLRHTSYPALELVVVDHSSSQRSARRLVDDLAESGRATVVAFDGPFNFSRMVNLGVAASRGDVVCLLNNDTEVVDPDWLSELASHAVRPTVGAVGGLLLFKDDSIQHAGIHPGLGGFMGHGHKYRRHGDPGYHGRLTVAHRVAAVTGACLALRREDWDAIGGMDEGLPVAFNDVDLCLRIRERGLHVVFTPHAVLRHHESASRGTDDDPARSARLAAEHRHMEERWGDLLKVDPAYHPDLSRDSSGFSLAGTPTTVPPWRTGQEPIKEA